MSILFCRNLTVDVSGQTLLEDINLAIEPGEKVGLVGPNGVGKTTLLRAILQEITPEHGQTTISGTIGYLPQSPLLKEEGTIWESMLQERSDLLDMRAELQRLEQEMARNSEERILAQYARLMECYERQGGYALEAQVRKILAGLGLGEKLSTIVRRLSGGEKTRLALAKLLLRSPEILILDEPTNHLDIKALEWLEGFLGDYAGAVLVVSHDRYFLDRLVTKIFYLSSLGLKAYSGNYSEFEWQLATEEKTLEREAEQQAKKIARLEEYIRRNKAGVNSRQARGRELQLQKIKPVIQANMNKQVSISLKSSSRSGDRVLEIEDLAVAFGSRQLFSHVELKLRRGDRVALLGANGVGKTSLLKAIMGVVPYRGRVRLGANVRIGYYSQEHEELSVSGTVIDEIRSASDLKDPEIRQLLARYGFTGEDVFKDIAVLSGGEKSRLALGKLFLTGGNLILLDEPTNHLDAATREVLEEALQDYDGTVLLVSHDRYFLDRIVTRIAHLTERGLELYEGDYTGYRERLREEAPSNEPVPEKQAQRERQENKEAQRKQKRIQKMEEEIADLEDRFEQLEVELSSVAADYARAMELHEEQEEVKRLLEQAFEAWAQACQ